VISDVAAPRGSRPSRCVGLPAASPEQLARARALIVAPVGCSFPCRTLLFVAGMLSFDGLRLFFVRFELRFVGLEIFFVRFLLVFVACEQNLRAMVLSRSPSGLVIEVERAKSGSGGIPREVGRSGDLYQRSWIYLGRNKVLLQRSKLLLRPSKVLLQPSKFQRGSSDDDSVAPDSLAVLVRTRRGSGSRIKAIFRAAIATSSVSVYRASQRKQWLAKLDGGAARSAAGRVARWSGPFSTSQPLARSRNRSMAPSSRSASLVNPQLLAKSGASRKVPKSRSHHVMSPKLKLCTPTS
jgi:hypothetical protein